MIGSAAEEHRRAAAELAQVRELNAFFNFFRAEIERKSSGDGRGGGETRCSEDLLS
jgi:hypothetical protein